MLNIRDLRIAMHEELLTRAPNEVLPATLFSVISGRFEDEQVPAAKLEKMFDQALNALAALDILYVEHNGNFSLANKPQSVWLEKSRVLGRADRLDGPFRLGRALWSPQRDKSGGDSYASMRDVRPGDLILHLVDNNSIAGVSRAAGWASRDFKGIRFTDWANADCYLINLKDYLPCEPLFDRKDFLGNDRLREDLVRIRETWSNLFYDRRLNLMQGFYLTPLPLELSTLFNRTYEQKCGHGLPHFPPGADEDSQVAESDREYSDDNRQEVPFVPEQGIGPKFAVREDGIVDFDDRNPGPVDSDKKTAEALHEVLVQAAEDFVEQFSGRTNQHVRLSEIASNYLGRVSKPLDQLNFATLYGLGLRLQTAFGAAVRDIEDRLLPELEDPQLEALQSLVLLHGVFIQVSEVGRQLLADADRYDLKREELPHLRDALVELGSALAAHPEIADRKVGKFFAEMAEDVDAGSRPDRSAAYSIAAFSNLLIICAEVATVATIGSELGAFGFVAGVAGAGALVAKSDRGQTALKLLRRIVADSEWWTDTRLKMFLGTISGRYARFVLSHEQNLLRISTFGRRLGFIAAHIEWLKRRSSRDGQ